MEPKKKTLVILTEQMPPRLRDVLKSAHPTATGLAVEETRSDQNVDQVGEQIKQGGLLIVGYLHRRTNEMLFRIVNTEDNWSTHWYKVLHAFTRLAS